MAAEESDDEWEEESMIFVELAGVVDQNWVEYFTRTAQNVRLLGVETSNPVLQVERYIFTGQYQDTVGTTVLFEEEDEDDSDDESVQLRHSCCTHKVLAMNRCFLEDKEEDGAGHAEARASTSTANPPLTTVDEETDVASSPSAPADTTVDTSAEFAAVHPMMMPCAVPLSSSVSLSETPEQQQTATADPVEGSKKRDTAEQHMDTEETTAQPISSTSKQYTTIIDKQQQSTAEGSMEVDDTDTTPIPKQNTADMSLRNTSEAAKKSPENRHQKGKGGKTKNRHKKVEEEIQNEQLPEFSFSLSTPVPPPPIDTATPTCITSRQSRRISTSGSRVLSPPASAATPRKTPESVVSNSIQDRDSSAKHKNVANSGIKTKSLTLANVTESSPSTARTPVVAVRRISRSSRGIAAKSKASSEDISQATPPIDSSAKRKSGKLDLDSAIMNILSGTMTSNSGPAGDATCTSSKSGPPPSANQHVVAAEIHNAPVSKPASQSQGTSTQKTGAKSQKLRSSLHAFDVDSIVSEPNEEEISAKVGAKYSGVEPDETVTVEYSLRKSDSKHKASKNAATKSMESSSSKTESKKKSGLSKPEVKLKPKNIEANKPKDSSKTVAQKSGTSGKFTESTKLSSRHDRTKDEAKVKITDFFSSKAASSELKESIAVDSDEKSRAPKNVYALTKELRGLGLETDVAESPKRTTRSQDVMMSPRARRRSGHACEQEVAKTRSPVRDSRTKTKLSSPPTSRRSLRSAHSVEPMDMDDPR